MKVLVKKTPEVKIFAQVEDNQGEKHLKFTMEENWMTTSITDEFIVPLDKEGFTNLKALLLYYS